MLLRLIRFLAVLSLLTLPSLAQAQSALPGLVGLPRGFTGCVFNSVPPILGSGQAGYIQCDSSGHLLLPNGAATSAFQGTNTATTAHTCAIAGFSELGCLGQIDDDIKAPIAGGTNTIGGVTGTLSTTNGITPKMLNALTNAAVAVKASGGQLYGLQCGNTNATQEYVQIYNIAQGSVTVGTSTPVLSIPIAATATGGLTLSFVGIQFATAISVAATTTATGATGPGTALDCNAFYN